MGTFDGDIRSAMQGGSLRDADPYQTARDNEARQRNMAQRGVNSTAYPAPQQAAPQQQPAQSNIPIPAERPTNVSASIDEQAGVPIPMDRPNPDAMQMGDGSAMEYAAQQAQNKSMLASKDAGLDPSGGQPQSVAAATGDGGNSLMNLMLAAGGSAAAVYGLLKLATMGDQAAVAEVAKSGMTPDQIEGAMSSIEATAPNSGAKQKPSNPQNMYSQDLPMDERGWPKGTDKWAVPYDKGIEGEIIPPGKDVGNAKMSLNNADDKLVNAIVSGDRGQLSGPGDQKRLPNPQKKIADERPSTSQSASDSDMSRRGSARSAKNLPNSRPKGKLPRPK